MTDDVGCTRAREVPPTAAAATTKPTPVTPHRHPHHHPRNEAANLDHNDNANMARALRRISVDRGVDTRECALIAFGGAAPMYAAELAREVGIGTVIVPRNSSVLSALGCLSTAPSYTRQRTVRLAGSNWDAAAYRRCCSEVAAQASDSLLLGRAGQGDIDLEYLAFMRYLGQSYAIEVACTPDSTGDDLRVAFWDRNEALYGYRTDEPYEVQSLRVTARMQPEAIDFIRAPRSSSAPLAIATVTSIFGWCYRARARLAHTPRHDGLHRARVPQAG